VVADQPLLAARQRAGDPAHLLGRDHPGTLPCPTDSPAAGQPLPRRWATAAASTRVRRAGHGSEDPGRARCRCQPDPPAVLSFATTGDDQGSTGGRDRGDGERHPGPLRRARRRHGPSWALHGGGVDHREIMGALEPLFAGRPGYRRVYPDLPGMGRTPHRRRSTAPTPSSTRCLGWSMTSSGGDVPGRRPLLWRLPGPGDRQPAARPGRGVGADLLPSLASREAGTSAPST
jgi:hypothetical protein